jgi:2-amino-4-hydroxy-6-hydroxymethyldihydropteridine diphosphokinase
MKSIYLSLGSNIGNRLEYINRAIEKLEERRLEVIAISKFYETAPQGFTEQPNFVNCCLLVHSNLEPSAVLKLLQGVELELERTRDIRWGPRTIDIDIIWVSDYQCHTNSLIVPHPRAFERAFVLIPLMDLPIKDIHLQESIKNALSSINCQDVKELPNEH